MLKLFISYSHKDEELKEQLETHLALLKRQGIIASWDDRKIIPGQNWENEIFNSFNDSDIILILISADFISSDYCYDKELGKAITHHKTGEKVVIPIILRECDWSGTPFVGIQGLPKDMQPVISRHWHSNDEAFLNISLGLKKQIKTFEKRDREDKKKEIGLVKEFITKRNTKYKFKGEIKNGKANGFGSAKFENGDEYIGNWKNGMLDGKGYYTFQDGYITFGNWKEDNREGFGINYSQSSNKLKYGIYKNDELIENFDTVENSKTIEKKCGFCGSTVEERKLLIRGIDTMICEVCTEQAFEIMNEEI